MTPDKSLAAEIEATAQIIFEAIYLHLRYEHQSPENRKPFERAAVALQSRAFEDGARWKATGRATVAFGGGGTREWFRQSDGCLKDYPTGFDPNTGAYSSMVAQWIDRPLKPEGERNA